MRARDAALDCCCHRRLLRRSRRARPTPSLRLVLAGCLILAGCGTRGTLFTSDFNGLPPVAAGGRLVAVEGTAGRAIVVAPDGTARAVALEPNVREAVATPSGDAVAVLSTAKTSSTFLRLDPATGEVRRVDMAGVVFDHVDIAPRGDFAVLSCSADAASSGGVLRNLNALAVIDIAKVTSGTGGAATRLTLDTDSLAPTKVVFAPRPAGSARQLVAVLFPRGLVLLDAAAPQQPPRRIGVSPQSSAEVVEIVDAKFTADLRYVMLRASGLDDLVAVELGDSGAEITASLNFLSGGSGLCALEMPGPTPAPAALALYCTSNQLMLLDARGQEDGTRRLQLTERLSALHVFPDGKVLAFDTTGHSRNLVAWDPVSGKTGSALLEAYVDSALFSDTLGKAVLFATTGTDRDDAKTNVIVVSIDEETSRLRIRTAANQVSSTVDASTLDRAGQRLVLSSGHSLALLDLGTLEAAELAIESTIGRLIPFDDHDAIAAIPGLSGQDTSGEAYLVDLGQFDGASTVRLEHLYMIGDLDRAAEGN